MVKKAKPKTNPDADAESAQKPTRESAISLAPLDFKDAVRGLLETKPPRKAK